jgi:hypothetical protein
LATRLDTPIAPVGQIRRQRWQHQQLQEGIFYYPLKHKHFTFAAILHFFGGIIQRRYTFLGERFEESTFSADIATRPERPL